MMKRLTPAWLLAGLILAGGNQTQAQAGGQHDFDFWVGSWKCQCRRLVRPLSGSTEWMQFSATNVTRPLLDGKEWLDDNPKPGVVRWEQAFSADGGMTWETNAVSEWVRD